MPGRGEKLALTGARVLPGFEAWAALTRPDGERVPEGGRGDEHGDAQ